MFTPRNQDDLLEYIRRNNGITVFPDSAEDRDILYEACVALELRGQVYRAVDKTDRVIFKIKQKDNQ